MNESINQKSINKIDKFLDKIKHLDLFEADVRKKLEKTPEKLIVFELESKRETRNKRNVEKAELASEFLVQMELEGMDASKYKEIAEDLWMDTYISKALFHNNSKSFLLRKKKKLTNEKSDQQEVF
ncbi:MAG: hypothetical protein GTO02_00185 [Candidatus Dadabacteria bacterium]|nr:hypothetical protein [Candidatus Dadabacteria bacterium]NIQ12868.1 hypothetical protein [Candidatus Dadabacteria bacterium]